MVTSKRTKITKSPKTHRQVFIFGAGGSASCGIAVAKDILRASILRLSRKDSTKTDQVHKLLDYLYPSFNRPFRNYPNIEDFLNQLEMAKKFNTAEFIESNLWPPARLEKINHIILKEVTEYIWDIMQGKDELQVLKEFVAGELRVGDTVITFNWDLTAELALMDHPDNVTVSYSYLKSAEDESVFLLKPHGSINWFIKKNLPDGKARRNTTSLDKDICAYPHSDFAGNPDLRRYEPLIVPPVSTKEYEYEFLKRTWRNVYRAVSGATLLYVIGYSLPPEDQFARLVLRRAIRNNLRKTKRKEKTPLRVTVVNPDKSVATTFSELVGPKAKGVNFYPISFQDYAAGLLDQT